MTKKRNDKESVGNTAEIQREIIRRVLEEESSIEESHNRSEKIAATIEALDSVTDLSEKEKKEIADQVIAEFSGRQTAQKKNRRIALLAALAAAVIALCAVLYFTHRHAEMAEIGHRMVFAHKVDKIQEPLESITEAVLEAKPIYVCVYWTSLPVGTHPYRIEVTDGAGVMVWSYDMTVTNKHGNHYTWSRYTPRVAVDKPGNWKFKITLDGKTFIEAYLPVKPATSE